MIADLEKQQKEEYTFKEECDAELKDNTGSTEAKTEEKEATQTKIDDPTMATSNRKDTYATLKSEVAVTPDGEEAGLRGPREGEQGIPGDRRGAAGHAGDPH